MKPTLKDICKTLSDRPPQLEVAESKELTRAEKRRIEREQVKNKKTFNMTGESFNAALRAAREDERERVKRFVISYYSAAVAITLHDKWGFGNKRLTRLANQINYVFDSILLGYVDIEDILTAIAEETGVIL